ncbi:MAG: hypothetical protein J1E42_06645 [Akkermansiaceae bacterium]|nr:hypothetical protein [Akkermansiaceae bacterium]
MFENFLAMAPLLADISPQDVGGIIVAIIAALGGGTGLYQAGKAKAMRIEPQPLRVTKPEDEAYITRREYNEDIKRLYDLYHEQTTQLNQLIGLVSGINKFLQNK